MKSVCVWKRGFALLLASLMVIQSPVSSVTAQEQEKSAIETIEKDLGQQESDTSMIMPDEQTPSVDKPTEEPSVEAPSEQEPGEQAPVATPNTVTAKISISYSDLQNMANRQEKDGAKLFCVFADGIQMEQQPIITLDSEIPQEANGVQNYTYTIHDLPRYGADGVTPVSYTIKENAPIGYQATPEANLAAPQKVDHEGDMVQLIANENGTELQGEKTFGNYLPSYIVEGKITWPDATSVQVDRPDMESYFKTQFTILRNESAYKQFRVEYSQDETDKDVWKYSVSGLFTTTETGEKAVYSIQAGEFAGYDVAENSIRLEADRTNADFVWTAKVEEKKAATRAVGDVDLSESNGAATMEVNWMEAGLGETHTEKLNGLVTVTYTIHGETQQGVAFEYKDGTWNMYLTDDQKTSLGITDTPSYLDYTVGTGTENFKLSKLPSKIKVEQADGTKVDKTVTWQMQLTGAPDEYLRSDISSGDVQNKKYNLIKSTAFTANIVIRNGGKAPQIANMETHLDVLVDGTPMSIAELKAKYPQAVVTLTANDTGYGVSITGILWCDNNKKEIIYAMKCNKDKIAEGSGDSYIPNYDNMYAPNFGTNTTECHDKGSLVLTLTGTTVYEATKIWLDEGDSETVAKRPKAVIWSLWRYSEKQGGTYKTASPVLQHNGTLIGWRLTSTKNEQLITSKEHGDLPDGLPKYDTDGYPYVYFTKEDIKYDKDENQYEKAFGVVENAAGGIKPGSDVLPAGKANREETDESLYNKGTLCNRITKKTEVIQKKTWKTGAHQNEVGDVRVELSLSSREKGSTDENAWTQVIDDKGKPVVQELKDFRAEMLTQELRTSQAMYNKLGKTLEYQWRETAVYEGADSKTNLLKKNPTTGELTFELAHNKVNGKDPVDGKEWYQSTIATDGTIVNQLVGETKYYVDKLWAQLDKDGNTIVDGKGDIVYGKTAPSGAKINVKLKQDNALFDDITLDGTEAHQTWAYLWDKLPKYNADGVQHIYVAEEATGFGWHAGYAYNIPELKKYAESNCQIKNKPTDVGKMIKVKKIWLDDGDEENRETITVEVWRKEVDANNPARLIKEVQLTAASSWWQEVVVSEYMVNGKLITEKPKDMTDEAWKAALYTKAEYAIREVKMGSKVVYDDEEFKTPAQGIPADNEQDYVNTDKQKYVVAYEKRGNEYCVSNRRIGRINVTAEKKWLDGGKTPAERAALNATLTLQCEEYPDAVKNSTPDEGYIQLVKDGVIEPIYGVDNMTPVGMTQVLTGESNQKVCFYNLPKYDDQGKVIHYSIKEESPKVILDEKETTKLEKADYKAEVKMTGYDVPDIHHDTQQMEVTNKKVGNKDVVFYKKWIDKYVFDSNKRPDIYLTLYKSTTDEQGNVTVGPMDKYVDNTWDTKKAYDWTCTYEKLPKYDDFGNEIFYYASEGMHVDRSTLDYIPEQYEHESVKLSTLGWDDGTKSYTVTHATGTPDGKKADYVEKETSSGKDVLKEGGTFVNELRKPLIIQGKKVWRNIPDGFPSLELPKLNIIINRVTGSLDTDLQKVATIENLSSTKNQMDFKLIYEGKNTIDGEPAEGQDALRFLPKYNSTTGEIHTYKVTESVPDAISNPNLETAYEKLPGEVNDYMITNSYNQTKDFKSNLGTLVINKEWINLAVDYPKTQYPDITFDIYRFYENNNKVLGTYSKLEKVSSVVLKQGATEISVENLLVSAPNGNKYQYFVQERKVNGYYISTTSGTLPTNVPQPSDVTLATTGVQELIPDPPITTFNLSANVLGVATAVKFTNTYINPQTAVTMTGEKLWKDYDNAYSSRPTEIELTVSRWADAQGVGNQIAEKKMFTVVGNNAKISLESGIVNTNIAIDISWDKAESSKWIYTISGLDRYAPNGSQWKYKVAETEIAEYTQTPSNGVVEIKATDQSKGNLTMNSITNTSYKSASFTKVWENENPHHLRPTTIKVKLQAKIGETGVWGDAVETLKVGGTGPAVPKALENKIADKEIHARADGTWKAFSYTDLPAYVSVTDIQTPILYRVVETKIGDTKVTGADSATDNTVTYDPAGVYQPEQSSLTLNEGAGKTDATKVTNSLIDDQVTSLKVVKNWDDSNNAYDTRPTQIKLKLQKNTTPNSSWVDVLQYGSTEAVTHILLKPDDKDVWEVEYKNLPKFDGVNELHYRAVEVDGGKNYDPTSVSTDDTSTHVTTITNKLTPTITIETEKKWENGQGVEDSTLATGKKIIVELKKDGKSFNVPVQVELDGTADGDGEITPWIARFKGMPKVEADGTDAKYTVVEVNKKGIGATSAVPAGFWKTESSVSADDPNKTSVITNRQTEFMLDKVDQDNKSFTGKDITLEIYKESGYGTGNSPAKDAVLMATWTRNSINTESVIPSANAPSVVSISADKAPIKGLPIGKYVLYEKDMPTGYERAAKVVFEVKSDGTIAKTSGSAGSIKGSLNDAGKNTLQLVLKDEPITIKLKKVDFDDDDNVILESTTGFATFTVTGTFADGSTEVTGVTSSNEDSKLRTKLIAGETYTFKETKAPDGYILSDTKIAVIFDADGKIKSVACTPEKESDGKPLASGKGSLLTVRNEPIAVTIKKVEKGNDVQTLPGGTFKLHDHAASTVIKEITTGANGLIELKGTDAGVPMIQGHTYTMTETTAPDGYVLPQGKDGTSTLALTFKVNTEGMVEWVGDIPDSKDAVIKNTKEVQVYNTPISLNLKKVDGENKLANAVFKLKRVSDGVEKTGFTTTADGMVILKNGTIDDKNKAFLVAGQTYILTETTAPTGYKLPKETLTFTIQKNGTITFKETSTYKGTASDTITISNVKTGFTIEKRDSETGKEIKDENLALTLKSGDAVVAVWKHTEAGYALTDKSTNVAYKNLGMNTAGGIEGLPIGDYTLSETKTPSGYLTIPEYAFTMKTDGTLAEKTKTANVTISPDDGLSLSVKDTVIRGHVKLNKTLNDGKASPLEGVEFKLYRQKGDKPILANDSVVAEFATDATGQWTTENNEANNQLEAGKKLKDGLPSGTYYYVETQTTADGVLDQRPHLFTIADNGITQPTTQQLNVENKKFSASIAISKYDEKNQELIDGDVTFKLTKINNTVGDITYPKGVTAVAEQEKAIGTDGKLTFQGLTKGTYHIVETSAVGYDISGTHNSGNVPFEANIMVKESDNGQIIVLKQETLEDKSIAADVKGNYDERGVVNSRLLGTVTLHKADGEDTTKALGGVEFKLRKKVDGGFIDWIKNLFTGGKYQYQDVESEKLTGEALAEKGTLTVTDLDWGTYQIVETTAKDGYSVTDRENGTVLATKEFTIGRTTDKVVELNTDGNKFYNYKTKLRIEKVGTDGKRGEVMKDAKFDLIGKYVDAEGITKEGTMQVVTDAAGKIVLEGTLIGGQQYILRETEAPIGYGAIATDLKFTMEVDGNITITEGAGDENKEGYYATSTGFFGNTITATDKPIRVQMQKMDAKGEKLLAGSEFTVTPKTGSGFVDTTETSINVTDENMAEVLYNKLMAKNSYVLTETKAPAGYELAEPIEFTVDAYGKVILDHQTVQAEVTTTGVDGEIEVITVKDKPISVQFLKRLAEDKVEEGVVGAVFTLTGKFSDGKAEHKFMTNSQPTAFEALLIGGETYTLTEVVAPDGAMIPNEDNKDRFTFQFTVDEKGVVVDVPKVEFANTTGIAYDKATNTITFYNQPTALTVFKKGADNEGTNQDPALAECTFDVTGVFAPDRYAVNDSGDSKGNKSRSANSRNITRQIETIRVTTTGEDGLNNALKGRLIIGETYTMKEIVAPNGYQVGGAMSFTVKDSVLGEDGRMKLQVAMEESSGDYDISYDQDGNVNITQRDLPVDFKLRKLNEKNEALKDAEFTVTGVFERENEESTRTFASDADGYIDLSKLISEYNEEAGKAYVYKIQEKAAPTGYQQLEGLIYLRLNSVDQGNGMHRTEAEVLYGESQTPEKLKTFLDVTGEAGTQILNIKNEKIPDSPTENPSNPLEPTPTIKKTKKAEKIPLSENVKTGDYSDFGWLLVLMSISVLVAGIGGVGLYRKRNHKKRNDTK